MKIPAGFTPVQQPNAKESPDASSGRVPEAQASPTAAPPPPAAAGWLPKITLPPLPDAGKLTQLLGPDGLFGTAKLPKLVPLGSPSNIPLSLPPKLDQFISALGSGHLYGSAGLNSTLVVPEADKTYTALVPFQGKDHLVKVSFDAEFAASLRERGEQFDVAQGEVVKPDGARVPMFDRGWGSTLGEMVDDAPEALKNEPVLVTEAQIVLRSQRSDPDRVFSTVVSDYASTVQFYANRSEAPPYQLSEEASALEPLGISESAMKSRDLAPGIRVVGLSDRSIDQVQESVDAVLGRTLASWPQRREAVRAEAAELVKLSDELEQTTGSAQARVIDQVQAHVGATAGTGWTLDEARSALAAKRAESEYMKLVNVEIVVVPKGKHWSAMPQWDGQRDTEQVPVTALGANVTVAVPQPDGTTRPKRLVFVPEEGVSTQRHELYHVVESLILTDTDYRQIDQAHRQTVQRGGPFARGYGVQRHEFLTTMGQLFEQDKKSAAWLRRNQPKVYEVLSHVTGRNPAA